MRKELREALIRQTEARQQYNALPDDASDDDIRESRQAMQDADQEVLELLANEEGEGAPQELRERVQLGRYMLGVAEDRALDGAERELNQEMNLADNVVPLEALEDRADAVSPQDADGDALGSGDINRTTGPLLRRVFTQTDAAFLGVGMPMVPSGERGYPVMIAGTESGMVARGAQKDAGAAKFSLVTATPKRLTGRYVFDLEGVAELGGMLESTLRADLRTEMGFQLDSQILLGSGVAPNVKGLIHQLDIDQIPGAAAGKDGPQLTWLNGRQIGTLGLDGKFSRTEGDIRLLVGSGFYGVGRGLFRSQNADGVDLISAMRGLGMGLRRSFQIPEAAALTFHGQSAASTKKTERAIANSEPMAAVAPVWQGITLIRDPYTEAGKAQIILTAHMLFDFVMRRTDGWHQYGVNVSNAAV